MTVTLIHGNRVARHSGLPMPSTSDYQGNDYKYGGKEFDMFQKVNIYDFAARTYIPDEGRFWHVPTKNEYDYTKL